MCEYTHSTSYCLRCLMCTLCIWLLLDMGHHAVATNDFFPGPEIVESSPAAGFVLTWVMLTPYKTRLKTQSLYFKYFKNTLEYLCTFFFPLMYLNFCPEWFKSNLWIQLYPFNWFPVYFQPCLRSGSNNGPTKALWNSTRTNTMRFSSEEEILATRESGERLCTGALGDTRGSAQASSEPWQQ